MMKTETMSPLESNDAELVAHSLRGRRDAFGQIVARYQSLVCSLAYNFTGSLAQSEDLAQETFVTAWKQLSELREPAKLRSWLCGITRNLSHRTRRAQEREPAHGADPMEMLAELPALEAHPLEQVISREEEGVLWRSLAQIPETYREPMILFYREQESVERVALALELSEDAVRQRLVRGRKLLHEQVLAFVEGALKKSAPGKSFTLGVVAALPLAAASAKAATVGAALAKGGAAAKGVATVGTLGGLLAMLGGAYVSLKAQADDSKSPRERQFMLQFFGRRMIFNLLLFAGFFATLKLEFFRAPVHLDFWAAAFVFFLGVFAMTSFARHSRRRRQIQIEDNTFMEAEWMLPRKDTDSAAPSPGAKSKDRLKAVKFMALGIGLTVFVITQQSWKENLGHAALITSLLALILFRGFLAWQNRPRYQSLRPGWAMAYPVLMGLMTLFFFNFQQYQAHAGSDVSRSASPAEIIAFNLVVVLAYAMFAGILFWKRPSALSLSH